MLLATAVASRLGPDKNCPGWVRFQLGPGRCAWFRSRNSPITRMPSGLDVAVSCIRAMTEHLGDFAIGEIPRSRERMADPEVKLAQIPIAVVGVVPIYNLTGSGHLRFTGGLLAQICMGRFRIGTTAALPRSTRCGSPATANCDLAAAGRCQSSLLIRFLRTRRSPAEILLPRCFYRSPRTQRRHAFPKISRARESRRLETAPAGGDVESR